MDAKSSGRVLFSGRIFCFTAVAKGHCFRPIIISVVEDCQFDESTKRPMSQIAWRCVVLYAGRTVKWFVPLIFDVQIFLCWFVYSMLMMMRSPDIRLLRTLLHWYPWYHILNQAGYVRCGGVESTMGRRIWEEGVDLLILEQIRDGRILLVTTMVCVDLDTILAFEVLLVWIYYVYF